MAASTKTIPPLERIAKSIIVRRSEKVLLDAELTELSGVPTKALNQAAKRNIELLGQEYENRVPVRPSKPFTPAYPKGAQAKGVQGEVDCIPEHRAKLVLFL